MEKKAHHGGIKVAALAGGVGGARLASGLAQVLPAENLTVIVNVGDDFDHLGLRICPDLDTVCYTLAGLANPQTGWGLASETWAAFEQLEKIGGPAWFRLGDRDLATHLERTRRLRAGVPLSQITRDFCLAWGAEVEVLPASDAPLPTIVHTDEGELPFQIYFVKKQCQPAVKGFTFQGAASASPAPGVLRALEMADVIILCPSNPWVSIDPILAVPGIRQALRGKLVAAISPIIRGQTVKGPAAKMYYELGVTPSAAAVFQHYADLLSVYVIDELDQEMAAEIEAQGVRVLVTQSLMKNEKDRARLAGEIIDFISHH